MNNLKYIAALDGLRAIAVILVFLYHSGFTLLPGGFVGVDIFFVLSGFLITQIVWQTVKNERFSYFEFMIRRANRLLPVYFLVISVVVVLSYFLLLPHEYKELSKSAIFSSTFLTNHYFLAQLDYFNPDSKSQLFLHTWSLSVEWQFYLLYPIVLAFSIRKNIQLLVISLLFVSSLIFSIYLSYQNSSAAFYILPSRVWEFLAGGLIAIAYNRGILFYVKSKTIGWVGLVVIVGCAALINEDMVFPGFWVLLPVTGSIFVMLSILNGNCCRLNTVLSNKLMVVIGKMSYSIYLWHWPILLFLEFYFGPGFGIFQIILAWLTTFLISYCSWRYVEKKARLPLGNLSLRHYLPLVLSTLLVLNSISYLIFKFDGFKFRLSDEQIQLVEMPKWPDFGKCEKNYRTVEYYDCILGPAEDESKVLLWGDSHAQTLIWSLTEVATELEVPVRQITKGGCPPVFFGTVKKIENNREACVTAQRKVEEIVASGDIDLIIISARWSLYLEGTYQPFVANTVDTKYNFTDAFVETLTYLRKLDTRIIILDSIPEPGFQVRNIVARNKLLGRDPIDRVFTNTVDNQGYLKSSGTIEDIEGVSLFQLVPMLCNPACDLGALGSLNYFDDNHLTKFGSSKIKPLLVNVIKFHNN